MSERRHRNRHLCSRESALVRTATWVSIGLAVVVCGVCSSIERRAARRLGAPEPVTFHIPAPPQTTVAGGPALSPDGRHVAFTAKSADGRVRIWVHSLNSGDAHPLAGTEDAFSPLFWSPDSRFVGFASGMTLKKVGCCRRASRYALRSMRPGIDRQPGLSRRLVERRRRHRLCHLEQRPVAHSGHWGRSCSRDSRRRLRISRLSSRWRARPVYLVRA